MNPYHTIFTRIRHYLYHLVPALCLFASSAMALPATLPFDGEIPATSSQADQRFIDMTFTLYPRQSGGSPVWTEIHLGIPVKNRRFHVVLGKNNSLAKLASDRNYYLAIQAGLKIDAPEIGSRRLIFKSKTPPVTSLDTTPPAPLETKAASLNQPPATPLPASVPTPLPTGVAVSVASSGVDAHELSSIKSTLDQHIKDTSIHFRQGTDSKLNADLLDGKDSSYFANKATLETHTQNMKNPHHVTAAQIDTYSRAEIAGLISDLKKKIATLEAKLKYVSVKGTDMHITGANLHIENGSGSTDGKLNGLGNLIVGYNDSNGDENKRFGSHNLIIGDKNNYTSYGGLVAGFQNTATAPYASVTGGKNNTATGKFSAITGGRNNTTQGENSVVSGGIKNTTIGEDDWAAGGLFQTQ